MFKLPVKKKGQISFEYIVLLGGIIVFTLIVLTVVRNILNQNTTAITGSRNVILNKTCNPTSDTDTISLIAYYKFDETTGNFSRDYSRNSFDLTGQFNSYTGGGVSGNSISLTTASNSTLSNKINFSGPFTIEFYVNIPDQSAIVTLGLSNNAFMEFKKGNLTIFQMNDNVYNYTVNVTWSGSFVYNAWNHIAVTYASNVFASYVDLNQTTFGGTQTANEAFLGARPATDVGYATQFILNVTGSVLFDELKIYNRALTLDEITADATCLKS